jgi:hypothetical protein
MEPQPVIDALAATRIRLAYLITLLRYHEDILRQGVEPRPSPAALIAAIERATQRLHALAELLRAE